MLVDVWLKQVKSEQVICIGHRLFFSKFTSCIVNCRVFSDSTVTYFLQYVYFYYSLYYIGSSVPRLHGTTYCRYLATWNFSDNPGLLEHNWKVLKLLFLEFAQLRTIAGRINGFHFSPLLETGEDYSTVV